MENKQKPEDALFNSLAQVMPEMTDVEMPEDNLETPTHDTLSGRMKDAPNLSDMQSVIKALLPDLDGYLDKVKVARIYPEEFDFLRSVIMKDLMKQNTNMSLVESAVTATTALSIALDGEGRIDVLRVAGAIKDSEETKAALTGIK